MIVEDEGYIQDLYEMMLEDTDYEIIRAYDGNEALSKLEEKKPDLIILDIQLDLLSGDTFLLYIKGMPEYADIPIIISSSFSQNLYKNLKEMDPDLVFLEKPITKEKLIEEIKAKIVLSE
jgi:CheY-like chemotaxis protein